MTRAAVIALWLTTLLMIGSCQSSQAPPPPLPGIVATTTGGTALGGGVTTGQPAALREYRYDLAADERRGGHTLERHVGRSDADLRARLRREPEIRAASTYRDQETAERIVAQTLDSHHARVERWLDREGRRPNLALDVHDESGRPIGRSLTRRSAKAVDCVDAVVVLRWVRGRDFLVLTSYPEAPQ